MVTEPGQAPRFVRSATAVVGQQANPGFLGADAGYWDGKFGISGVGGLVSMLAASGSTLYAVGDFAGPPGMPLDTFAKWDGTSWSAFGSGFEVENAEFSALAVSGETVYIAGYSWTGTTYDNFLTKWDGTAWSPLPWDVDDSIYVLAAYGDILYVGGYFTAVGVVSARNIAKWNGTSWSALGTGTSSSVYALAVSGDVLYAGGNFTSAGGVANAKYIAQWDMIAGTWSALGTGMNGYVGSLVVGDGVLYAGGSFTTAGGVPAVYLAQWDGANWSALGTGLGGDYVSVSDLAMAGSVLYVSGYFSIDGGMTTIFLAQWNGLSWSGLGQGMDNMPQAMAAIGSTLYVGGFFESAGGVPAYYIARWNGSWSDVDSAECGGTDNEIGAMAVGGSNLYIAGYFSSIAGVPADGLAKWDGTSWSAIPLSWDEEDDYEIEALAVGKDGNTLYAGGEFFVIGGVIAYNVAKWDGANWSALSLGILGEDVEVQALAVGEDESGDDILYVGGEFTIAGGQFADNIAKFEKGNWSKLGTGTDGSVYALTVSGSTLYVGGEFASAGGMEHTNGIAQWNDSTWSALGSGLADEYNVYVNALAVSGSTLYVGGGFDSAGGVEHTNGIAQWNGSTWAALGSGLVGDESGASVYALAVSDSALYVGGSFTSAGGVVLNNVAKWDGTNWSALGTGMDEDYPSHLAVMGSDLYVGGGFDEAGDVSSANIALWHFNPQSRKDDLLGTWDGQGVYFRNSDTGVWVKLASPATMITTGDLDGDAIDDLIGLWPTQGGIWVKYSQSGTWAKLSSTAKYICSGDMNGDGRVDLVGTWDGQGVFYRNSITGAWVKMASPATMVTAGDIDNDGTDDLIGLWPSQGGIWVKYSHTGAWARLSSTAVHIAAGDMNGDGRDDLLGTWDGQGVYYRDSVTGLWVKMASPATLITTGDIDGDATDDLVGIWPTQGGVWVKYSSDGTWERLSSTAKDITTGKMRAAAGGSVALSGEAPSVQPMTMELPLPMGGFAEGPEAALYVHDLSPFGPGGHRFLFKQERNLAPVESGFGAMRRRPILGPGEPGFICAEQESLFPQESKKKDRDGEKNPQPKKKTIKR
jgi:hypothetical protein